MGYFKFATAGSVDDGKSTLIGRLLYDLQVLKTDQLEALHQGGELNLAFATDGLQAEREKGITIDVAYRYFDIEQRRFVCVDAPGHYQYLNKAFTAFTQVSAVLLLVDVNDTLKPQFFMHLQMVAMLQIPSIAVLINKMDMVHYEAEKFNALEAEIRAFEQTLGLSIEVIPISALKGDNVVHKGIHLNWYKGKTVYEWLEQASGNELYAERSILTTHSAAKGFYHFEGSILGLQSLPFGENDLINGKPSTKFNSIHFNKEALVTLNLYVEKPFLWMDDTNNLGYYATPGSKEWQQISSLKTINFKGFILDEAAFLSAFEGDEEAVLKTSNEYRTVKINSIELQRENLLIAGKLTLSAPLQTLAYSLGSEQGKALLLSLEGEILAALIFTL